jgi:flagellar biosynthetic protein FliP
MRRDLLPPALALAALALLAAAGPAPARPNADKGVVRADLRANRPLPSVEAEKPQAKPRGPAAVRPSATPASAPTSASASAPAPALALDPQQVVRSLSTVALFALASLAPAAVLMLTAFVRINIVLVLLRQALGSPQVPGNQVLTALALLLTALVMRPVGESVFTRAVAPYAEGRLTWKEAYAAAEGPVKAFMLDQVERTRHEHYLWAVHDQVSDPSAKEPVYGDDFPTGEVATAYLLSELTTALVIGFYLYLPFLVVDLVVSAVLTAMGLFMLPPSLVGLPVKLILFVLVDGWLRVATMLLQSFGPVGASP